MLSEGFSAVLGGLAHVPGEVVGELYAETFPSVEAVASLGLFSLLFLTGLGE